MPSSESRRLRLTALAAVLAAAALLRLPALRSELWLDEVWSVGLARKAVAASDVFLRLHDDNNNPLNTLYLRLIPPDSGWPSYRFLSLAAGLGVIALLGWDPHDRARGLLAAGLAAVSTQMIVYATEARGYALMSLFSLAAFRLFQSEAPLAPARAAAFGACVLLGFLSHPTFVYTALALFMWAAAKLPRERRSRGLLELFAPAALGYGLFETLQLPLRVDGANQNAFWPVVLSALDLWSGAPGKGAAAFVGAAVLLGLLIWGLRSAGRERPDEGFFFAALFAGAFLFAAIFPFPFERHFYGALPFALILLAGALARLWRRGGTARAAACAFGLLFLAGNVRRDRVFWQDGRGRYSEAVRRMAADIPAGAITVASDHDARNSMLLEFYGALLPADRHVVYVPASRWSQDKPEWFLLHSFTADRLTAPIAVTLPGAGRYRFVELYPYGGLSGWTWMLYRREATSALSGT